MFVLTSADDLCCLFHILSYVGSGIWRQELALPIESNWVGFYLRTVTESSLRNVVFK
jgi:hypothetical protein